MSDAGNGHMVMEAGSMTIAHPTNGDETRYPTRIGNFHKGLPHDEFGEVNAIAYQSLLDALNSGLPATFEAIKLGLGRKLTDPQAGLATDVEGPNPHNLTMLTPPTLSSAQEAAEAVELYWIALLRDVPFTEFGSDSLVAQAVVDLGKLTELDPEHNIPLTAKTIFRGFTHGERRGPYISQFLLKDIRYGALLISQKAQTVVPGEDYLTDYGAWLAVQNGYQPGPDQFDGTRRYIRNMRDMGQWVHMDALYEAYLNACLILLDMKVPVDAGNPYNPAVLGKSKTQIGFGTFGDPHILSLVTEVATRALKTVWYQKWFVHRRLRPEEYGGLVHLKLAGLNGTKKNYPIHDDILNSKALDKTFTKYGTYLLPQAFPEGSPTHPSYGAGHATVAGACVTILKAWFDEQAPVPNPVVPTDDGMELVPYTRPDAHHLTVGSELNKLAANIAIGRNMAGVHWRSDYIQSVLLGEQVALCVLRSQMKDYNEDYSFTFTSFENDQFKITKDAITKNGVLYDVQC
ncbi:MAG: vanadium-dependent haloperoxidase [Herpetosiphonaceae bacterium]|nr:vanadium-dependent haloperoxidase [Herpetosiphonaceae bacterium]